MRMLSFCGLPLMGKVLRWPRVLLACLLLVQVSLSHSAELRFTVTNSSELVTEGRLLLFFTQQAELEPRFYDYWPTAAASRVFAVDVSRWAVGEKRKFNDEFVGFPLSSAQQLPPGTWRLQALLDHNGFAADLNSSPNLYSDVIEVEVTEKGKVAIALDLNRQIGADVIPKCGCLAKIQHRLDNFPGLSKGMQSTLNKKEAVGTIFAKNILANRKLAIAWMATVNR